MKISDSFLYQFNREEIQEEVIMDGKYSVEYDYEDDTVFEIRVNVLSDCPQFWETIDPPSAELYRTCEQHLLETL